MKKYISVRIVSAEPMKAQRPTGKYDKGADGMRNAEQGGINYETRRKGPHCKIRV